MKKKKRSLSKKRIVIPKGYRELLDVKETEIAIKFIKDYFQTNLAKALRLRRVSAPIAVLRRTGINDYLNGVEKPVSFKVKELGETGEIVQSLAKWKRHALADYGFKPGEGLYTDMNAIRPDEELDNIHSIYVDQWDWETVLSKTQRNIDCLKSTVRKIYRVIKKTEIAVCRRYPALGKPYLPDKIHFIHSEDLQKKHSRLSPMEREDAICCEKGAVFIIGIGSKLADGIPHDGRAADYDDWVTETGKGRRGLNGDILVWYPLLRHTFELSSMGIRVDKASLMKQLKIKGELGKAKFDFHRKLIHGKLPLTMGGGIGQSRLCMIFLRKAHIGEIQASIWPETMIRSCKRNGIHLL